MGLLLQRTVEAAELCNKRGLPMTFVTEDTTRSKPDVLAKLFKMAIDHGAARLCLCDTVGHATPDGVNNLIQWTRNLIEGTGRDVKIDWHGHSDRGLAIPNAMQAIYEGVDRVHGTGLGIGDLVPKAVRLVVATGGGVAFGYAQPVFLVR